MEKSLAQTVTEGFLNEAKSFKAEKSEKVFGTLKISSSSFDTGTFTVLTGAYENEFDGEHDAVCIADQFASTSTDGTWIPKENWEEFKKIINSVKF